MKKKLFNSLKLGVYRVYWKSGGSSLAAIGQDHAGNRWVAPTNWTGEAKDDDSVKVAYVDMYKRIEAVVLLAE
jgi:hypothetical protein